jgi:GT2 family glycosyltransferase
MRVQVKVSVLLAVHNGADYLQAALESVIAQTFRSWELIVVDDGSTDDTPTILTQYARRRERMHVLRQTNSGQTRALNAGLAMATGEYIARLDADDVMLPSRLEQQVSYLDAHPEVVLLGSAAKLIDGSGQPLCTYTPPCEDWPLRQVLIRENPFVHPSVLMRAVALRSLQGYDERFRICQDYDLWFRLAQMGAIANLAAPLTQLRVHLQKMTWTHKREEAGEGLAIRWAALRRGSYSPFAVGYLLKPLLITCMPERMIHLLLARRQHRLGAVMRYA